MTKSELFKAAHKMTRLVIKSGDSYSVTFGACLHLLFLSDNKDLKDMFDKASKFIVNRAAVMAYLKTVAVLNKEANIFAVVTIVYGHFLITNPIKFCNPDFYGDSLVTSPDAFAAYLNYKAI